MDFPPTPGGGLEPWEIEVAGQVVRAFFGAHALPGRLQFEDLVQECLWHWWQQRRRYSALRGASAATYMRRILEKKLLDIERAARATKRGGRVQTVSLDDPVDPSDPSGATVEDRLADDDPSWSPDLEGERRALADPHEKEVGGAR